MCIRDRNEHFNNRRIVQRFGAFFVAGPTLPDLPGAAIVDRDDPQWEQHIRQYLSLIHISPAACLLLSGLVSCISFSLRRLVDASGLAETATVFICLTRGTYVSCHSRPY